MMNPMAGMNLKGKLAVESFVESTILLMPDFDHTRTMRWAEMYEYM